MPSIRKFLDSIDFQSSSKWIVLASLVGIVSGLGAVIFQLLGQMVAYYSLSQFAGYTPPEALGEHSWMPHSNTPFSPWMIVVTMTLGGLVSGIIVYTSLPKRKGMVPMQLLILSTTSGASSAQEFPLSKRSHLQSHWERVVQGDVKVRLHKLVRVLALGWEHV